MCYLCACNRGLCKSYSGADLECKKGDDKFF